MSEIKNIPEKYQPDPYVRKTDQAQSLDQVRSTNEEMKDDQAAAGLVYGSDVNIKLTKAGLTFSGPSAFVSNMSPCDFIYNGQPYSSTEQGIQHLNALHHQVPEIADKIMKTTCAKKIKVISHDIPKSETWKKNGTWKTRGIKRG